MIFFGVKMLVLPLKIVPLLLFSETISFEGESREGGREGGRIWVRLH